MKTKSHIFALLIFQISLFSCTSSQTYVSPPGYNLNKPKVINLSKKIDEISGMVYYTADKTIFAIDDNTGFLYNISLKDKPEIKKWKFEKARDYEDVVLVDSTFYVLESNGNLFSFAHRFPVDSVREFKIKLQGFNEFETLYYEAQHHRLIMLCKECDIDKKKVVSAYAFDLKTDSFSTSPVLELKRKNLENILDDEVGRVKASAGTINPLTGEVFIVSSINKLLIVADPEYNVKEVYKLDPKRFGQPEGICFAPDGTMYISNEASGKEPANILIFKYK